MNNKKFVALVPLLFFIAMALLLYSGLGKDPTKLDSQLVGKPIPEFSKPDLLQPERILTQNDIKGPALINVFGSWCPSCYQEHPYLMQMAAQKLIRLYGLNYKDTRQAGLKYIQDQGNPYDAIIHDENGRLGIEFGVYGAPETFVINAENRVVYRHVGVVTPSVWEQILKPKLSLHSGSPQKEN